MIKKRAEKTLEYSYITQTVKFQHRENIGLQIYGKNLSVLARQPDETSKN